MENTSKSDRDIHVTILLARNGYQIMRMEGSQAPTRWVASTFEEIEGILSQTFDTEDRK
jgi:hypothetical protein